MSRLSRAQGSCSEFVKLLHPRLEPIILLVQLATFATTRYFTLEHSHRRRSKMWGHRDEDSQNAYESFYGGGEEERHKAKFSHEAVAGAAGFFAMHEYEKRERAEGQEVNHGFAKEMLAGIAAGEVDKLAETKGLDYLDRERAKRDASEQAQYMYDQHYSNQY